jgi:hypothetical protein
MGAEPPTPVAASEANCPAAIATSFVAPTASLATIACWARWTAIDASCAALYVPLPPTLPCLLLSLLLLFGASAPLLPFFRVGISALPLKMAECVAL